MNRGCRGAPELSCSGAPRPIRLLVLRGGGRLAAQGFLPVGAPGDQDQEEEDTAGSHHGSSADQMEQKVRPGPGDMPMITPPAAELVRVVVIRKQGPGFRSRLPGWGIDAGCIEIIGTSSESSSADAQGPTDNPALVGVSPHRRQRSREFLIGSLPMASRRRVTADQVPIVSEERHQPPLRFHAERRYRHFGEGKGMVRYPVSTRRRLGGQYGPASSVWTR